MNVYEEAHNLARAIKDSNEFKEFDHWRAAVEQDEQLKQMINSFEQLQLQMTAGQMNGQGLDPELMSRLQSMYTMLAAKPEAARYLEASMRFSLMMKDVGEILADAVNIKLSL
ncbi:MAG: YlbF family regulator [Mogibacterium sp.]|nr:YlbF family regulator [Mogibacterium sp.]